MGRKNGTWSPIYGQAWTHAKTARAADVVTKAGHRPRYAAFLVLGWLHRLNIWCLANDERGVVATLSDAKIAAAVWPESLDDGLTPRRAGQLVRAALRAGGFLEDGPDGEQVHEFRAFHARLLKDRGYQRERDEESPDSPPDLSGDTSGDHSGGASGATVPEPEPEPEPEQKNPHRPPSQGAPGAKAKPVLSPAETAARHLAAALGSNLAPCRKQVHALRHAGWDVPRIERAIADHAEPGLAPWDWTKRARGAGTSPAGKTTGVAAVAAWAASRREESA